MCPVVSGGAGETIFRRGLRRSGERPAVNSPAVNAREKTQRENGSGHALLKSFPSKIKALKSIKTPRNVPVPNQGYE